jgi:hypothetical protein
MIMSYKTIATVATLGIAALWSSLASAQETAQATATPMMTTDQPAEREVIRPNRPLLLTGAAVIAASYIPPVVVAATSEHKGDEFLYIPLAGPWIDLADRGGCGPNSCEREGVYKGLLVTAGIAHLVGTGLIVSSLVVPEEHTRTSAAAKTQKPMVLPAQVGRSGAGLTLVGTF